MADEAARWSLIRTELLELRDAYGDERRSVILGPTEEIDFDPEAYIVRERTWVMVSRLGRIKRQKGFSDISAIRNPMAMKLAGCYEPIPRIRLLSTQLGSLYTLRVDGIGATTGYGELVQSQFNFSDGERIIGVTCSDPTIIPSAIHEIPATEESDVPPPHAVGFDTRWCVAFSDTDSPGDFNKNGRRFASLGQGDEVLAYSPAWGRERRARNP